MLRLLARTPNLLWDGHLLLSELQNTGICYLEVPFIQLRYDEILSACTALFASPAIEGFYCGIPSDGHEVGFHSFALNAVKPVTRGRCMGGIYDGLPHSGIWCHASAGNPVHEELISSQKVFDGCLAALHSVAIGVGLSLMSQFEEIDRLSRLCGLASQHSANHLRIIYSPAASDRTALSVNAQTGMVCRHRPHVDNCVLTLVPFGFSLGGSLYHYSLSNGESGKWQKVEVPPGAVAVFAGTDLETFTSDTLFRVRGLVHQVLATPEEALHGRHSLIYRLCVDPDAAQLTRLDGSDFSFRKQIVATGAEYYRQLVNYRKGD